MSADSGRYRAAGRDPAADDGLIFAFYPPRLQVFYQRRMGAGRPGDNQEPRGVLVEAMYDPGAGQRAESRVMVQQGIDQGMFGVAGARMHDQPGRFIDQNQAVILMDNGERYGLRPIAAVLRDNGVYFDAIRAFDPVFLFQILIIDAHITGRDPGLQPRPGMARKQRGQGLIQPSAGQRLGHGGL